MLDEFGKLKDSGYLLRDKGIKFNRDVIKPDASYNYLKELTKMRHQTLIITFSPKKISIQRLFDFGINCIALTIHMLKGSEEPGVDPLLALADDMTTKEPMGIVNSDVESVSVQPFNVTSYYMNLFLTEKEDFDKSKYDRVLNLHEKNVHPHNFELNFDIFFSHEDQALTMLQNQTADGKNFMAWSSRLALESFGNHFYNAHRKRQDETIRTLSSVLVSTGMPLYGQGNVITLISNGFIEGGDVRFGFEF
jgi:hypothetical protein